jgi:hypothetical protein
VETRVAIENDQPMPRPSPSHLAALTLIAAAVALAGSRLHAGATLAPPKVVPCGDVAGGTWVVRDRLSGKGLTGSHYTVAAVNFPCATARTLAVTLTRRKSLGPGPTALLRGYMCITGIPKGLQLAHGGCSVGTSPILLPTGGIKSFKWQACTAIPARHEHMTCTTRRLG